MKYTKVKVRKSGVIPNASYSNLRPGYEIVMELEDGDDIEICLLGAKEIVNKHFELDEYRARVDLLKKQFKTISFYDAPEGLKYPSITSILNYDKEWFISKGELLQYGSMGTINHEVFWVAIKTYQKKGKIIWVEPSQIKKLQKHIGIVLNGSLGLNWDDYSYKKFGDIYIPKLEEIKCIEHEVLYPEIKTGGRLDIVAKFEGKWSIIDLKTGGYDWRQLAFYAKAWNLTHKEKITQMVIFPIGKTQNKCGYEKPKIETDIDRYWDEVLDKREEFKNDFNV